MRSIIVAIATMAFATLAPLALAAEGQGDNNAEKQPTMAELKAKMDAIGTEIAALAGTVGNLSSTVTTNHTTIVGKFAPRMAVVMAVPIRASGQPAYYLVGDSTGRLPVAFHRK